MAEHAVFALVFGMLLFLGCCGPIGPQDNGCYDEEYGYLLNGQCSWDESAICKGGIVYPDLEGECEGTARTSYGNCYGTDYGDLGDGECSPDGMFVCVNGEIYVADAYPCPE